MILNDIAFATLSTVLPSLERKKIIETRILQRRNLPEDQNGMTKECLVSPTKAPLYSARQFGHVMRAKRGLATGQLSADSCWCNL